MSGWRLVEWHGGAWIEDLRARENGGEEREWMLGEEDEVTVGFWLFESFKESVLGWLIHSVGRGDNEEAWLGFTMLSEGEKIT